MNGQPRSSAGTAAGRRTSRLRVVRPRPDFFSLRLAAGAGDALDPRAGDGVESTGAATAGGGAGVEIAGGVGSAASSGEGDGELRRIGAAASWARMKGDERMTTAAAKATIAWHFIWRRARQAFCAHRSARALGFNRFCGTRFRWQEGAGTITHDIPSRSANRVGRTAPSALQEHTSDATRSHPVRWFLFVRR